MPLAPIESLDIVDCHHHFWDLSGKNHPWLCDPVPVHFRYGDYSSIKRNYFPADYRRDVAPYRVVKTVHEEAWWDRRDPVAETRWLEGLAEQNGLPNACVAAAWPARDDIEEVLAGQRLFDEMRARIEALGFVLFAIFPGYVHETTGRTLQLDGFFLRRELTQDA